MDVGFFLKDRLAFIRQFYDGAALAFSERKRKIEAGEDPYAPPYSEDGEPPFLSEWLAADESLQVLGYSCISMLAAALHLCLKAWEAELRIPVGDSFKSEFKKKGWLNGYRVLFASCFDIHLENGPANWSVLEEIVLARNRTQHPSDIVSPKTGYSSHDLERLPRAFFVDERERGLFPDIQELESFWLFAPSVHVTRDKLMSAIAEVEKFSEWLKTEITLRVSSR